MDKSHIDKTKSENQVKYILAPSKDGYELVGRAVSDLDGKYGFPVDQKGEYRVEIFASGFSKLESKIQKTSTHEIIEDFALSPSQPQEMNRGLTFVENLRKNLIGSLNKVLIMIFAFGAIYSSITLINEQSLINYIFFGIYSFIFLFNAFFYFKEKFYKEGRVVDSENIPVAGVAVRIYNENGQLGVFITNFKGVFKVKLPPGEYMAKVSKNLSSYSINSPSQRVDILPNGYLKEDIVIDIAKFQNNGPELTSPFS